MPLTGGITNVNYLVEDQAGQICGAGGQTTYLCIRSCVSMNWPRQSVQAMLRVCRPPWCMPSGESDRAWNSSKAGPFRKRTFAHPGYAMPRVLDLVMRCHIEGSQVPARSLALVFWVFHVMRDYAATTLLERGTYPLRSLIPDLVETGNDLARSRGRAL